MFVENLDVQEYRRIAFESERKTALRRFRQRGMPGWARDIVEQVAQDYGVTPAAMVDQIRWTVVCRARHAAMYRIKEAKETVPLTVIARWFDRDHTTIGHGMAAHAVRNGLRRLNSHSVELRTMQCER